MMIEIATGAGCSVALASSLLPSASAGAAAADSGAREFII